jgi:hypothetical protein
VRVVDTAQILGIAELQDIAIACDAVTLPGVALSANCTLSRATIANRAGALAPCATTPNAFDMTLFCDDQVFFDNGAVVAQPILQLGSTGADSGTNLTIYANMGLSLGTNSVKAAAPLNASVEIVHDDTVPTGYFAAQNPTLAAATTDTPLGGASSAGYTPAVPGNWVGPAPTTVAQALDRMAANIPPVTPIP